LFTSLWAMALASVLTSGTIRESAGSQTEGRRVPTQIPRDDSAPGDRQPDSRPARMALIPAGTVISNKAPLGWTHLIDKSHPKMHYGDVDQVPKPVRALSGMFFTAMLARVRPPDGRDNAGYRLDEVAIAMGTRIGAADTIITPETQKRLGAHLGLLPRIALERGYERFKTVTVAARTSTMAVVDGPAMMLRDGKHRPVVLRYAILVHPRTGDLETLLWAISQDDQGAYEGMISVCEWLLPNQVEERLLHVDATEFAFGLITENAMAIVHLCKGRMQIGFPPDVKRIAAASRLSQESAQELEKRLWALLQSAAASDRKPKGDA
jgi:hypothetical protein